MADVQSNIQVNIDTGSALASLKSLQSQLSSFNASFSKSSAAASRAQADFATNLINSVNATNRFTAGIQNIQSSTERFTQSIERNKFSTREYFRYAAGSTKAFSRMFSTEFNTIQKVAEERVKDLQTQYIKMGRNANGALQAIAVRPLSLDMEDLATKVAITSQKQQIFGQLLKQGSTNLLNFGKNTQWAGRQLMVGFTIPLTIFGSKAAQVFMDLETQAIKFKRVYGDMFTSQADTNKALADVRKLAQEFTKYGVAVSDTIKLAADAAAQGKQGADLMAQVTEATKLAVLGQVDQQQALQTTISLQNAFGYSSDQLSQKIDFLNAVENQTVLNIEDLTVAIPKAGPVVKQLGGSVEDLAFFMTAMKEGGINASEGANALKSGLAALINPSNKASQMLADLGINIKGIVEANKGDLKGTVVGFAQALDQLKPLERSRAIEQLFGKFQFARLSTLFQNVVKDSGQASRALDLTTKSVEELAIISERELGTVENATTTKFKKSMENLKTSIAPVGEQFLKAITPIAEFVSKILKWFDGLSDGVKSGVSKMLLIVGGIGPIVLMAFGLLANGLANIIKLFGLIRNGFLGLGKNSSYLANQTQYMSSQQQEAATIAASLDQAHSKLIQTFTVEQSAVEQLANAYRQAVIAGGNLQQTNPAFFTPGSIGKRKGFAGGIISVPGPKGAGDVMPAMLSPGEAVIPTAQNEKYAPLVRGIIADNIPGFRKGITSAGTQFAHVTGRQETTMGSILSDLESLPAEMKQARAGLIALVKDIVNSFGSQLKAFKFSGLGFAQSADLNNAMKDNKAVSAQAFLEDFKSQGTKKWEGTLKYAGTNATAVGDDLAKYDKQLEIAVQKIVDLNENATITSSQFEAIEKEIRKTLPEFSQLKTSLDKAESTMTEFRFNPGMQDAILAGLNPYQVASKSDPTKMSGKRRVTLASGKSFRLGGEHAFINVPGAFDVEQSIQEIKRSAGVASPSKKTIPIGEDIAKGIEVGMQNRQDDVSRNGQQLGNAAVSGVQSGVQKGQTRSGRAGGLVPSGPSGPSKPPGPNGPQMSPKAKLEYAQRTGPGLFDFGFTNQRPDHIYSTEEIAGKTAAKEQQLRDAEMQKRKTILARTNGIMFGMTALSSVLGMMGNGIAQKAAPFMAAINVGTMALQMIQGPWSALAVGVVALVGGLYYMHQKAMAAAANMSKLVDASAATSQRIKDIGKLTGKVGASELFERKRQGQISDRFTTGYNRAGQQFGTSFLASDVGKNIFDSFTKSLSSQGQGAAIKQFGSQLAIYVSQGLMSGQQAESIARAIGVSMSDMTITTKINGELRQLIGPEGSDLLKDPLKVRLDIVDSVRTNAKDLAKIFSDSMKISMGFTGGAAAAKAGYQGGLIPSKGDIQILTTAAALNVQNLETVQQQVDSQNKMYDDQIKSLQVEKQKTKDKNKLLDLDNQINDLTEKRKNDEQKIRDNGKEIIKDQENLYKLAIQTSKKSEFLTSVKTQVSERYKGGPQAEIAQKALDLTKGLGQKGFLNLELKLNTLMGSGMLTPLALTNLLTVFKGNEAKLDATISTLFETQDPGKVGELLGVMNSLSGSKGGKKIALDIVTKMSAPGEGKKFDSRMAVLQNLMTMDGKEINMALFLKINGVEKLDQLASQMDAIENLPNPITKKVLAETKVEGVDFQGLLDNWDFYSKLPDETRKTAIQTYETVFKYVTENETEAKSQYIKAQIAKSGATSPAAIDAITKQASKVGVGTISEGLVQPQFAANLIPTKTGKGKKTGTGTGQRDTTFDDMLKKLKLFQQATVNATGGIKELLRVINAPAKKGGAYMTFNGITDQLINSKKLSTDFMDMIEGLSSEELQKKLSSFGISIKNGVVNLNNAGKSINKALASIAAGELVAGNSKAMQKLQNQISAVNILRRKGVDYETAMAITQSDSIALAIKNGEISNGQLNQIIKSQKTRNDLEERYNRITMIRQQDAVTKQQMANDSILAFLELQKAIIENQSIIARTEIDLASKRNGYALELISYEEKLVNDVYDKQISALDEIQKRQEQINGLQQARLSIVQALTKGDMASAAQALQAYKQQQASAQAEQMKQNIEQKRQQQLKAITADGKTRDAIEKENADNARKLAEINLDIVKRQTEVAKKFTQAMGMTPEQAKAYSDIATSLGKIGGFNLDDKNLVKAIKDAIDGDETALLSTVQSAVDQTVSDIFSSKVAKKAIDNSGVLDNRMYGVGNNVVPEKTSTEVNTDAITDNTAAIEANTAAITGEKAKTTKPTKTGGKKTKGGGATPQNLAQADNQKPKSVIKVRNGDTTKPATVFGSNIDISVKHDPETIKETVAWIEHQQKLADEQDARNKEQLASVKKQEESARNVADAVNRISPKVAEIVGIYQSTATMLGISMSAQVKAQETKQAEIDKNNQGRLNDIKDSVGIIERAGIGSEGLAGVGAVKGQEYQQAVIDANNESYLYNKKLDSEIGAIVTDVAKQRQGLNEAALAQDKKTAVDLFERAAIGSTGLSIAGNVKGIEAQQAVVNQNNANRLADIKLSNKMLEIYSGVGAQIKGQQEAAKAADKRNESFVAIATQANNNIQSIRAIEGRALPNIAGQVGAAKIDQANKTTARTNINQPLTTAAERAAAQFRSLYESMGGLVPKYMADGGILRAAVMPYGFGSKGTDTIPAMLTPGEFVINKPAVDSIGINNMNKINQGELPGSVYNYSLTVNLNGSNMNANDVAKTVMRQIKQVEYQRVRGI